MASRQLRKPGGTGAGQEKRERDGTAEEGECERDERRPRKQRLPRKQADNSSYHADKYQSNRRRREEYAYGRADGDRGCEWPLRRSPRKHTSSHGVGDDRYYEQMESDTRSCDRVLRSHDRDIASRQLCMDGQGQASMDGRVYEFRFRNPVQLQSEDTQDVGRCPFQLRTRSLRCPSSIESDSPCYLTMQNIFIQERSEAALSVAGCVAGAETRLVRG